jgi:hypothetical protein
MPFNGAGVFSVYTPGTPYVTGTIISSTVANNVNSDFATGLSSCITKNGQTTITANIPMGGFKITGLGAGTVATDSANLGQIQNGVFIGLLSVAGTDTITASTNPVTTSYATYQKYVLVPANNNTGAVTIDINSLGAKAITKQGSTALVAGDLVAGVTYWIIYDGTRFQVTNPGVPSIPAGSLTANSVTSVILATSSYGLGDNKNIQINATVAASALTLALKTQAGTDATATDVAEITFRSATLGSGAYVKRAITAALSTVISSGSTGGTASLIPNRLYILAIDNAGTVELAWVNSSGTFLLDESTLISTTAEGGAGGADSANVIYSTTSRANVAFRLIGYIDSTQTTAGTWATNPSTIQVAGGQQVPQGWVYLAEQASTSGTAISFTGIPMWATEVEMILIGVSTNGTSDLILQAGTALVSYEVAGYLGSAAQLSGGGNTILSPTTGFAVTGSTAAAAVHHGVLRLSLENYATNTWACTSNLGRSDVATVNSGGSTKSLASSLDRVRLTTVGGANTFDAGVIVVRYRK